MRSWLKHVIVCLVAMVSILVLEDVTDWDIVGQRWFFDGHAHVWMISEAWHGQWGWLLYTGPKVLLIVSAVVAVFMIAWNFFHGRREDNVPYIRYVLALTLVPLVASELKAVTHVHCPKEQTIFYGDQPFTRLVERERADNMSTRRGRCFPAGHASGGYALMVLFYCFQHPAYRWAGLGLGLTLGSLMGIYQICRGYHYISHTLFTIALAWLIIVCLVRVVPLQAKSQISS